MYFFRSKFHNIFYHSDRDTFTLYDEPCTLNHFQYKFTSFRYINLLLAFVAQLSNVVPGPLLFIQSEEAIFEWILPKKIQSMIQQSQNGFKNRIKDFSSSGIKKARCSGLSYF